MRWERLRGNGLSIRDLARFKNLSIDDLPWNRQPSPWPLVGMFGLGLAIGALAGMAAGAGPARDSVEQAAGWTRDRGRRVARRVRHASDEASERLS